MNMPSEAKYPITFRKDEAERLGTALRQHNSVVLVGMKRVGISNFLRFFLYHEGIAKTYIKNGENLLLVAVDLNDLVEREVYPFWVLVLKRLVDTLEHSPVPESVKTHSKRLFTESIQLKDQFFTFDSVQKVLDMIVKNGYLPVLFLVRFDRLKEAVTPEFFGNLQRLKDASQQKLSYVFTSYRPLYELAPTVFTKSALSVFAHDMYLKPAAGEDMQVILETFETRYGLTLSKEICSEIINLAGGHVNYLQLALIRLKEEKKLPTDVKKIHELLSSDEQLMLQGEELLASLTKKEQELLLEFVSGKSDASFVDAEYLLDTGMVTADARVLFSPLFKDYLQKMPGKTVVGSDLTKKEHTLFTYLQKHEGNLCEREDIVESVWPEQAETGISDWAVDRLVARLRVKLKGQNSPYEIVTVITRGYKLVKREG